MSIPNPNPNIRDLETVDNYTWSSNKINSVIDEKTSNFKRIATADFFESTTNVGAFDAFQYGKLIIIQRLTFTNVTTSGAATIASIKSKYLPDANIVRLPSIIDDAFKEVDILKSDSAFKSSSTISNKNVHMTNIVYITV